VEDAHERMSPIFSPFPLVFSYFQSKNEKTKGSEGKAWGKTPESLKGPHCFSIGSLLFFS
jgi:hypothetical protein